MQKVTTFITFNDQAEEAVNLYVSLIPNSHVTGMNRYPGEGPNSEGAVMTASFVLDGQEFIALNGGPTFNFAEGVSLYVNCETQEEVDELWEKLSEGGEKGQCGWLKDKFGLSWQIIPSALGELMGAEGGRRSGAVVQAMMQMTKLEISGLQRAFDQG